MKKTLLIALGAVVTSGVFAQTLVTEPSPFLRKNYRETNAGATAIGTPSVTKPKGAFTDASRAITATPIGTSGNPFTIINNGTTVISNNPATNQIVFIHRTNRYRYIADDGNNGQYRYDISRDGGATWSVDLGLLNPSGTQSGAAARFPMVDFYNRMGNTNPDSSFLVYLGSYHDGGATTADWLGYYSGRARLDNTPTMFSEKKNTFPSTGVATSLTKSTMGTYWACDRVWVADDNPTAITVYKGVWNADSSNVFWSLSTTLTPPLDLGADGKGKIAQPHIAFDPTGTKGWICLTGDINTAIAGQFKYDPILYRTIDGGNTWTGPIRLDIDSINGIEDVRSAPEASLTITDMHLTVDANGNPHILANVLESAASAGAYFIVTNGPKRIYDINWDDTRSAGCKWLANKLSNTFGLRHAIVTDQLEYDLFLQSSRSEDGTKLFFFWADTDSADATSGDNQFPNFFGVGLDITGKKLTPVKDFTSGTAFDKDVKWPHTASIATTATGTYKVPTVFTRFTGTRTEDSIAFHYIDGITFTTAEFTRNLDQAPPTIVLNGAEEVWVLKNGTYSDLGATASDCVDGNLTSSIVTTGIPSINTSTAGTYYVGYGVADAAGNRDSATRTVIVSTLPVCQGIVITPLGSRRFRFSGPDYTAANGYPKTHVWILPSGSGLTGRVVTNTFATVDTQRMVLRMTNPLGSTDCCFKVVTTSDPNKAYHFDCNGNFLGNLFVGIQDNDLLERSISLFPNPANNTANISMNLEDTKNVEISVYNVVGKKVAFVHVGDVNGEKTAQLNVNHLADGMYTVKIETDKGSVVKKLQINK